MPIRPNYTPRHQYEYSVTENIRGEQSGGGGTITTSYDTTLGPQVTGKIREITTTIVVDSYSLDMRYVGPVNISDCTIHNKTIIRSISSNPANIKKAQKETGISDPDADSCGYKIFACITALTCTCCLFRCCFNAHHKDRREKLDLKIKELDESNVSEKLVQFLKAADDEVDRRIKFAQQNQGFSGTGTQGAGTQQALPPQPYGITPSPAMVPQYNQGVQLAQPYGITPPPAMVPQYNQGVQLAQPYGITPSPMVTQYNQGVQLAYVAYHTASAPPAYGR